MFKLLLVILMCSVSASTEILFWQDSLDLHQGMDVDRHERLPFPFLEFRQHGSADLDSAIDIGFYVWELPASSNFCPTNAYHIFNVGAVVDTTNMFIAYPPMSRFMSYTVPKVGTKCFLLRTNEGRYAMLYVQKWCYIQFGIYGQMLCPNRIIFSVWLQTDGSADFSGSITAIRPAPKLVSRKEQAAAYDVFGRPMANRVGLSISAHGRMIFIPGVGR